MGGEKSNERRRRRGTEKSLMSASATRKAAAKTLTKDALDGLLSSNQHSSAFEISAHMR